MAEEAIKKWVEEKLDEGVDKDRIKSILEDKGYDPALVDEVESPFASDKNNSKEEDDDFEFNFADRTEEDDTTERSQNSEEKVSSADDQDDSSFSVPSLSLNIFDRLRNLPVKSTALVLVLLLGAGLALTMMPDIDDVNPSSSASDVLTQEIAFSQDECPEDTGVRIESITQDGNTINAEILVSIYGNSIDEADVVLELYSNGDLVDSASATLEGRTELTAEGSGDELVLRPVNCGEIRHLKEL